jgi:poly(3-hydroxybutyrate) depolymerase
LGKKRVTSTPGVIDYSSIDATSDSAVDYGAQLDEASGAYFRLPEGYDPESARTYPLLIHLHGSGWNPYLYYLSYIGMGYTSLALTTQADQAMGDAFRAARHCFVLVPITEDSTWDASALSTLIDSFIATWPIDENRVYAHGWSMGGTGTRNLAITRAAAGKPLAAIFSVTGSLAPSLGDAVWSKTSVWAGCGDLDPAPRPALAAGIYAEGNAYWPEAETESLSRTRETLEENISSATLGGLIINRLVTWPALDHDSRDMALSLPELIDWTFTQSLSNHP